MASPITIDSIAQMLMPLSLRSKKMLVKKLEAQIERDEKQQASIDAQQSQSAEKHADNKAGGEPSDANK